MTEHDSANDYQTRGMKDLRDYISGASEERNRAAVNKLLSLNGGKPVEEKSGDVLTRELLKSTGS